MRPNPRYNAAYAVWKSRILVFGGEDIHHSVLGTSEV
jgi:hypothetical protein